MAAVEEIVIAEEAEDERVRRMLVDHLRRVILLDPAGIHHRDPVGDFKRLLLIMRHENGRDLDRIVQLAQPAAQFPPHRGIERAEWLIEQKNLRLDGERAGQCNALALAARQLRGIVAGKIAELNERQKFLDLGLDRRIRRALAPRLRTQAEGDVLEYAHLLEQGIMLKDEADPALAQIGVGDVDSVEQNFAAGIGCLDPGDNAQKCRLARAARAEQRDKLARFDLKAYALQRLERAVGLADPAYFDAHRASPLGPRWRPLRHVWSSTRPPS